MAEAASTVRSLIPSSLFIAGGAIAGVCSWVAALLNTVRLEDKTWFLALLVLGLCSLGWLAIVAYVVAGPDSTRVIPTGPGIETTRSSPAM